MEWQRIFSFKSAKILCLSFTAPFTLFLAFWAFSTSLSLSSQIQLWLSPSLKNVSKSDASPSSNTNLSIPNPKPKDLIPWQTLEADIANPPNDALDFNCCAVQNGVTSDPYLVRSTFLSKEGLDLQRGTRSAPSSAEAVISNFSSLLNYEKKNSDSAIAELEGARPCEAMDGRWVYDESYPLYSSKACPYIDEGFSCEANGRTDTNYMKWRWQPNSCNIPRFDPLKFLDLIRGKRLVFIGDSINRNQWESMMCLLNGAILNHRRVYEARGRRITKGKGMYNFKFMDYHCSVEYYVTHFLVLESKARVGQKRVKTLRIDTMDRSSSKWKGADILIFNTAHWWSHDKTKVGINYYQEGGTVHSHLDVSTAFRKALTTWASWIDTNINANKTQVFFRSSAPTHFSGGAWNSGGHCKESTAPLNYTFIMPNIPESNLILDQVLRQMRTPVTVLNITGLSGLRIDGHPSVYGKRPGIWVPLGGQDCSHWCLPGVPDSWNELLYFFLLSSHSSAGV